MSDMHNHCQSLLGDRPDWVYMMIYSEEDGFEKTICQGHWQSLCMVI